MRFTCNNNNVHLYSAKSRTNQAHKAVLVFCKQTSFQLAAYGTSNREAAKLEGVVSRNKSNEHMHAN